jgi:acetone carboxylase gamma subunit
MSIPNGSDHCPNCERTVEVHAAEPWLPAVCKGCGASIE